MNKHANRLINALKEQELTLALAESMTSGLASHMLAGCIGASDVLKGSIVCYTPEVKMHLLNVPKTKINKYTCESEEVTQLLAKNLQKLIKADVYAGITGLAAEGGSESKEKPVGTVFISVYYRKKLCSKRKLFRGSPVQIRKKACAALYKLILDTTTL